jgi:hypothetical protein
MHKVIKIALGPLGINPYNSRDHIWIVGHLSNPLHTNFTLILALDFV